MKLLTGLAAMFLCAMLTGCGIDDDSKTFTISGVRIVVGMGTTASDQISADNATTEQLPDEQSAMDPQEISVVITRADTNDDGTSDNNTIASGSFTDNQVVLDGEIAEPTKVLISVSRGNEEILSLEAIVVPDANTSFALLDHESPDRDDQILLLGDSRIAEISDSKFTIEGDLSSIVDKDLSIAFAYIDVGSRNPKEGSVLPSSEPVLLHDGSFLFEGVVSEPLLVNVRVRSLNYEYMGGVSAVVEPGAQISISPSKSSSSFHPNFSSELMAYSEKEGSMHSKVVESWQNSANYLEKMSEYADVIEKSAQQTASASERGNEQSNTEESSEPEVRDPYDVYQELQRIAFSGLTSITQNLDEPMTALLAMEYGALHGMNASRELENWNKLADVLDKDLVARRVTPQRESLEKQIKVAENSKTVVEGHIAPKFTLANLDGEEIALYDVLAKNEVVLIDFWASWCGPCIDKLPKLKEMHTEYKDKGFEIVFVSIDDTYEDWKEGSEQHEVPGVNVGDLHGFLAETPVAYGVQWIPTEFLIDPAGEILDRDLTTKELEDLLVERYGGAKKQEEPNGSTSDDDIL